MRSVYAQASADARRVLALCWAAGAMLLAAAYVDLIQQASAGGAALLKSAVIGLLGTAGVALLVRQQLSLLRGGAQLTRIWLPPLGAALVALPIVWVGLSSMVSFVWAPILLQRSVSRVLVGSAVLGLLLWWRFPSIVFQIEGPFISFVVELSLVTALFVVPAHLAVLLDRLSVAREVLARRRVDEERERVNRDLHDIMGRTLVAASLRNQSALRALGDTDAEGTQRLEALHQTISRGQGQVRALTSGPAISRLDDELENCRSLCARVGIDLTIDLGGALPVEDDRIAALAVRESVTNALKHSRVRQCSVTIDREGSVTLIRVGNDGWKGHTVEADRPKRLADAVLRVGGTVESEFSDPGWYYTVVRLPQREKVRA